jgi:hypothetical protein
MRQAFTPYAGTALSQPALWAGGLIPRAMYIRPFSAFNNLERLLAAGGYRRYISVDEILSLVLDPDPALVRLDAHLTHPEREDQMFKFRLCGTLQELRSRLDADGDDSGPLFFYSQPQDMHIRVLSEFKAPRYEAERIGSRDYFGPAVAALRRIDACFGDFIDYLKATRRFDDSIVVLTSDHGDAYGEDGRWGHANYVSPQTVRIPLIIRVPETLRRARVWNPHAVTMLTDIVPTLYELLGYRNLSTNDVAGKPFLALRDASAERRTGAEYLMQSSYSDALGLMDARASWLYTADANQLREQYFDLQEGDRPRPLTGPERLELRRRLLEAIQRLNDYYVPSSK